MRTLLTWFAGLSTKARIVVAAVVLIAVCGSCGGVMGALGSAGNTPNASVGQAAHAGAAPTATIPAAVASGPTAATPQPTVSPNTLMEQHAVAIASNNDQTFYDNSHPPTAAWDATNGELDVTVTIGTQWDSSSAQDTVKIICFDLQQALWTNPHWGQAIRTITVTVNGPLQNTYGQQSVGSYGYCTLTNATEQQFVWANLDWSSAWAAWDDAWVRTN